MNLHDTYHLLNTIKTRCNLKTLDLIKVNLNSESIEMLGEVIRTSRTIQNLDISWN